VPAGSIVKFPNGVPHDVRPRLFEQTWMSEATHGIETVVRLELDPKDGGTQVTLTHSGLPDDEAENHRKGWEEILTTLDDLR